MINFRNIYLLLFCLNFYTVNIFGANAQLFDDASAVKSMGNPLRVCREYPQGRSKEAPEVKKEVCSEGIAGAAAETKQQKVAATAASKNDDSDDDDLEAETTIAHAGTGVAADDGCDLDDCCC